MIRSLLGVFRILDQSRNLIFVSKMSNTDVHTIFENDILCKMVQGTMVLMRGVQGGTLYKLFRKEPSFMDVTTVLFSRVKMKKEKSLMSLLEILCCGIEDVLDILERWVFKHSKVKVWLKVCLIANHILDFASFVCMVRRTE